MTNRSGALVWVHLLILSCCCGGCLAYNRPGCKEWPNDHEWDELRNELSQPKRLNGPFYDDPDDAYTENCLEIEPQTNNVVLDQGFGLCMHNHNCASQECAIRNPSNVPAYTLEAINVPDIQAAV